MMVLDLVHPRDVVLEVGGRYGLVSCAVALAQNNSGNLITVEADTEVWAIHQVCNTGYTQGLVGGKG